MNPLLHILLKALLSIPVVEVIVLLIVSRLTHAKRGVPDGLSNLVSLRIEKNIPWSRNALSLTQSTVALVSVAGFFIKGQPPFREGNPLGDFEFRIIHRDINVSQLTLSKYMVDRRFAMLDPNMLFPISRMWELGKQGFIKQVALNHFSFYGYTYHSNHIVDGSAKDVARRLRYEGVDKVLVIPGSVLSQETAFLVQRSIEEEGIPTVSLAYTENAIASLKPPRTCLFKKGSLCQREEYLDADIQMNLVKFMLGQFDTMRHPGSIANVVLKMSQTNQVQNNSSSVENKQKRIQKDLFNEN